MFIERPIILIKNLDYSLLKFFISNIKIKVKYILENKMEFRERMTYLVLNDLHRIMGDKRPTLERLFSLTFSSTKM